MDAIVEILSKDHSHCDDLLFQTESNMEKRRWELGIVMYTRFKKTLIRHLTVEEATLFPALAEAVGASESSINSMRIEHRKILQAVQELDNAAAAHDIDQFVDHVKALGLMLQQHNCNEEQMLYTMSDHIPAAQKEKIITAVRDIEDDG